MVYSPNPSRILMVTREQPGEKLFGLGKSLAPVIGELKRRGYVIRYLSQQDMPLGMRSRLGRWQVRLASLPCLRGCESRKALLGAWLERFAMALLAARLAEREHFTHVHLHDPWLAAAFRFLRRVFRLRRVRWGITEHGFGSYARATRDDGLQQSPHVHAVLRRLEAKTLTAADWVVVPTRRSLVKLTEDLNLIKAPRHWQVIPHARPVDDFPERGQARSQLGWCSGQLYVLGIGRLVPLKRFDLLVRACAIVARQVPLNLVLLGAGDVDSLHREAASCGLHSLTIIATEHVPLYIAAADIYVSSSQSESFGLANLEALGGGLPAVCTAVGGVPEVVGDAAVLIPANDVDALVKTLSELAGDAALRHRLGEKGREQFLCWPDLNTVGSAYVELYR